MHGFVANLTEWKGKEVRVDLVARIPASAITPQKARWTSARIIASEIDYTLGPPISVTTNRQGAKGKRIDRPGGVSTKSPDVDLGEPETILIKSATNIPDTAISTVKTYGESGGSNPERWFTYFNGVMEWQGGDAVTDKSSLNGTIAFDLKNYTSYDLYDISASNLLNTLLRGTSQAAAAPAVSGTPFRVIKPHKNFPDNYCLWDNWYTVIHSNVKATTDGITRVHAFVHVEDISKDGANINSATWTGDKYMRIGYARSEDDHGYDFDLNDVGNYLMSDSMVGHPTPAIECWFPESSFSGLKPSNGVGSPSIIQSGKYYYMFYTRWLFNDDVINNYGSWPSGTYVVTATGMWDTICAARAPVNDVINEDYSGLDNPWKKYYNGSWDEPGRGELSTPVIRDGTWVYDNNSWRAFPKVIYHNTNTRYVMLCGGALGFYLYSSPTIDTGDWGTGMRIEGLEDNIAYPSLIGETGDDKIGEEYYMLYYGHRFNEDQNDHKHTMRRRWIGIEK